PTVTTTPSPASTYGGSPPPCHPAALGTPPTATRCTSQRWQRRSAHMRIPMIRRRFECLLDRSRRRPAEEVPHRSGLVVRAGGSGPAEGLLPDDCSGRFVVDVEV